MRGPLPFLAIDTVTSGPAFEFVVEVLLQKSTQGTVHITGLVHVYMLAY